MEVLSANIGPLVIKKLAIFPASMLPVSLYIFNNCAGVFVRASKAAFSERPYCTAFRRFGKNCFVSFKSAAVKQKLIPFFSKAAGLVGAISHCFKSSKETNLASLLSSTSIAKGKLSGKI